MLATKHEKLPLVAPPLEREIGMRVEAVAVDTDVLGTFTGDVPRPGPPLDTAVAKARLGLAATGATLGLASEGSVGPDPALPLVQSDHEIVVLVDDEAGLVIWERAESWDVVARSLSVEPGRDLDPFLAASGFPEHRLIVRPSAGPRTPVHKGIASLEELRAAVAACAAVATDGRARVENDLRAHACPSRRVVIAAAAARLATRVARRCPACGAPGWGQVELLLGIPCSACGTEVAQPRAEVDGCVACDHRTTRPVPRSAAEADPSECPFCNA